MGAITSGFRKDRSYLAACEPRRYASKIMKKLLLIIVFILYSNLVIAEGIVLPSVVYNNMGYRVVNVIQIEIGVKAPFRFQSTGSNYDFRAVIIAPNVPHKVDDHDEWQLMLHIEPYSLIGRQLLAIYLRYLQFREIEFGSIPAFPIQPI